MCIDFSRLWSNHSVDIYPISDKNTRKSKKSKSGKKLLISILCETETSRAVLLRKMVNEFNMYSTYTQTRSDRARSHGPRCEMASDSKKRTWTERVHGRKAKLVKRNSLRRRRRWWWWWRRRRSTERRSVELVEWQSMSFVWFSVK